MHDGALIVAMNQQQLIGVNGDLPWHLPDDLKWFKQQTLDQIILMGANTFASLGHKPLPHRKNWVLSRTPRPDTDKVRWFHDWSDMFQAAQRTGSWVVIGGAALYALALPHVERAYINWVDAPNLQGDTYFPKFDITAWRCVNQVDHPRDDRHAYAFQCCTYLRKTG